MDFNKLLNVSTQLGKMLLENGAEIYRVEESIQRMGLAYGAKEVDVYAVPTTIIITITTPENINITYDIENDKSKVKIKNFKEKRVM